MSDERKFLLAITEAEACAVLTGLYYIASNPEMGTPDRQHAARIHKAISDWLTATRSGRAAIANSSMMQIRKALGLE